jgi:hypothetical protein
MDTENKYKFGDFVVSKKSGDIAIIDRIGTFHGVYRVVPALDGEHWKSEDQLEVLT